MPIHAAVASKFHLLEGISSFQQFVEGPDGGGPAEGVGAPRWIFKAGKDILS